MKKTKQIIIKTGLGYFINKQGDIISKYQLNPGIHPLKENLDFVEVLSHKELDSIKIFEQPLSEAQIWKQNLQKELLLLAEERLQIKGIKKPKSLNK